MANRIDKFEMQQRNMFTRLKKEPEKNKSHWDYLLKEMKWMSGDFELERKNKRKTGVCPIPACFSCRDVIYFFTMNHNHSALFLNFQMEDSEP